MINLLEEHYYYFIIEIPLVSHTYGGWCRRKIAHNISLPSGTYYWTTATTNQLLLLCLHSAGQYLNDYLSAAALDFLLGASKLHVRSAERGKKKDKQSIIIIYIQQVVR